MLVALSPSCVHMCCTPQQLSHDCQSSISKCNGDICVVLQGGVPTVQDALDLHFILSKSDTDLRQPVGLKKQLMADNRLDSVVGMSMLQLLQACTLGPCTATHVRVVRLCQL